MSEYQRRCQVCRKNPCARQRLVCDGCKNEARTCDMPGCLRPTINAGGRCRNCLDGKPPQATRPRGKQMVYGSNDLSRYVVIGTRRHWLHANGLRFVAFSSNNLDEARAMMITVANEWGLAELEEWVHRKGGHAEIELERVEVVR